MEKDTTVAGTSGVKKIKKTKPKSRNKVPAASKTVTKKMTMLDQVCEAIEFVGLPRKGATVIAIKKCIFGTLEYEESMQKIVNSRINQALKKGLENGRLVRPGISKNSVGATGRFFVAETTVKDKNKKKPTDEQDEVEELSSKSENTVKSRKNVKKQSMLKDLEKIDKPKSVSAKPKNVKTSIVKKPKKNTRETLKKERNNVKTDICKNTGNSVNTETTKNERNGVKAKIAKALKDRVKTETAKKRKNNAKTTLTKKL